MDGVEATKAIRAGASGEHNKTIPIIAITAYAMDGDKKKFLAAGLSHYIAKPIDMTEIKEVFKNILKNRSKNQDLQKQKRIKDS